MNDGILSAPMDLDRRRSPEVPILVEAVPGLRVTHVALAVTGTITAFSTGRVQIQTADGRRHVVANDRAGFRVDGRLATLTAAPVVRASIFTASGSVSDPSPSRAQVARSSRIWVEGIHDAELVERVWGDELRAEAIVVEPLHGIDDLVGAVTSFGPGPGRRLGVLVDHLEAGTKESRIAAGVRNPHVLVTGHRFVDVWAAVRPEVAGLKAWPNIPHGQPWKEGVCAAVGVSDPVRFWRSLLARVSSYRDLDASLVGAVEQLLDFVLDPVG